MDVSTRQQQLLGSKTNPKPKPLISIVHLSHCYPLTTHPNHQQPPKTMCCRRRKEAALMNAPAVGGRGNNQPVANRQQNGTIPMPSALLASPQIPNTDAGSPPPYENHEKITFLDEKKGERVEEAAYLVETYPGAEPYHTDVRGGGSVGERVSEAQFKGTAIDSSAEQQRPQGVTDAIASWYMTKREKRRARCAERGHWGCCKC